MMLWKVLHSICNMQYALNMQYAGSRHPWGLWAQLGKAWALLLGTGGLGGPFSTDPLTGLVTPTLPRVLSLGWEDPLEEDMAIRSSILA